MTSLLHSKFSLAKLTIGFLQSFDLLIQNVNFALSSKAASVAQKGKAVQTPFFTQPSAKVSFTTYVRDEAELGKLIQLGYEKLEAILTIVGVNWKREDIGDVFRITTTDHYSPNQEYINSTTSSEKIDDIIKTTNTNKLILRGQGKISGIAMTGSVGQYYQVRVDMILEEYQHNQTNFISLLI